MFKKKDRRLKTAGPDEACEQTEQSYFGSSQKGSISRQGIILIILLLVAGFAVLMTMGKFNAPIPGLGKSADERLHNLEMEMIKVKSLQERVTFLEITVAKKLGQLQGQDGKPLKDEVSDLNKRLDELEKKASSAGSAKKKSR